MGESRAEMVMIDGGRKMGIEGEVFYLRYFLFLQALNGSSQKRLAESGEVAPEEATPCAKFGTENSKVNMTRITQWLLRRNSMMDSS